MTYTIAGVDGNEVKFVPDGQNNDLNSVRPFYSLKNKTFSFGQFGDAYTASPGVEDQILVTSVIHVPGGKYERNPALTNLGQATYNKMLLPFAVATTLFGVVKTHGRVYNGLTNPKTYAVDILAGVLEDATPESGIALLVSEIAPTMGILFAPSNLAMSNFLIRIGECTVSQAEFGSCDWAVLYTKYNAEFTRTLKLHILERALDELDVLQATSLQNTLNK